MTVGLGGAVPGSLLSLVSRPAGGEASGPPLGASTDRGAGSGFGALLQGLDGGETPVSGDSSASQMLDDPVGADAATATQGSGAGATAALLFLAMQAAVSTPFAIGAQPIQTAAGGDPAATGPGGTTSGDLGEAAPAGASTTAASSLPARGIVPPQPGADPTSQAAPAVSAAASPGAAAPAPRPAQPPGDQAVSPAIAAPVAAHATSAQARGTVADATNLASRQAPSHHTGQPPAGHRGKAASSASPPSTDDTVVPGTVPLPVAVPSPLAVTPQATALPSPVAAGDSTQTGPASPAGPSRVTRVDGSPAPEATPSDSGHDAGATGAVPSSTRAALQEPSTIVTPLPAAAAGGDARPAASPVGASPAGASAATSAVPTRSGADSAEQAAPGTAQVVSVLPGGDAAVPSSSARLEVSDPRPIARAAVEPPSGRDVGAQAQTAAVAASQDAGGPPDGGGPGQGSREDSRNGGATLPGSLRVAPASESAALTTPSIGDTQSAATQVADVLKTIGGGDTPSPAPGDPVASRPNAATPAAATAATPNVITIELNPQNLGRVTVTVRMRAGTTAVRIEASNRDTLTMLAADKPMLVAALGSGDATLDLGAMPAEGSAAGVAGAGSGDATESGGGNGRPGAPETSFSDADLHDLPATPAKTIASRRDGLYL